MIWLDLNSPLPAPTPKTEEEMAELQRLNSLASSRRIVLLAPGGVLAPVEAVLAEPSAGDVVLVLQRLSEGYDAHRMLAAEWRAGDRWERCLWRWGQQGAPAMSTY